MMYNRLQLTNARSTRVQRGFTLLVAVILTSVILSVSLALLDVAYKQVILASISSQSQSAFYSADSGLECALYQDYQSQLFDYNSEPVSPDGAHPSGTFSCQGSSVSYYGGLASGGARLTTFSIPCVGDATPGDASADVTVYKSSAGVTHVYSNGYNSCKSADARRVERGLTASY